MRAVIRILADSPLVERIALDHENNNVKIYYKSDHKNSEYIREIISVLNYYFEKEHETKDALVLVGKKEKVSLSKRKDYYLNTYTSPSFDIYRVDVHDSYMNNDKYYNEADDIIDVELTCLEYAKEFIFGELRKKTSVRKCVIEFNYMNIKGDKHRNRYIQPLKQLPKTISRNIDISLVRVLPDEDLLTIDATLAHLKGVGGQSCLSIYFQDNLPLVERALNSQAEKVYLTVDFKYKNVEENIGELHKLIKEHPNSKNIYIIQYNIDKENAKMIGEMDNTMKFSGRQSIKNSK